MPRRTILLLILAFVIISILAFFILRLSTSPGLDTVTIALTVNLDRQAGVQMQHGVELALAQTGYQAGDIKLNLLPFNIAAEDVRAQHRQIAEAISNNDDIVAVIGAPSTTYARDTIPIYNEAGLAIISPSATWAGLTKPGYLPSEPGIYYPTGTRNFFRSIPTDDIQAFAAAQWLAQQNWQRIYLLAIAGSRYSEGIAGILEANAPDWGLQVVGSQAINLNASSVTMEEIIVEVQRTGADVIYYPVVYDDETYQIVLSLQEHLPDIPLLSTDGLSGGAVGNETPLLEGVYATSLTPPFKQVETAAEFVDMYRATYNDTPSPYALTAYDAALAVVQAIEQAASPTRSDVINALHNLEDVEGAMGTWQFDKNGDISLSYVTVMQFQEGSWHIIDYAEVD